MENSPFLPLLSNKTALKSILAVIEGRSLNVFLGRQECSTRSSATSFHHGRCRRTNQRTGLPINLWLANPISFSRLAQRMISGSAILRWSRRGAVAQSAYRSLQDQSPLRTYCALPPALPDARGRWSAPPQRVCAR